MKTILAATALAAGLLPATSALAQTAPAAAERTLSRADALVIVEKHFARLDANRDGFVTKAEAAAADRAMEQRRQGQKAAGQGGPRPGFGSFMLLHADTNKDGRMSLVEAQALGQRHFDMADADRNGVVTGDEHRQMRQRMIDERGPG